MSSKILTQLRILETLYFHREANATLEKTLDKIISQELQTTQQKSLELEEELQNFEQHYQISSAEFYQKFHLGQLGDNIEFVEWNAFYEMWQRLQEHIELLQSS